MTGRRTALEPPTTGYFATDFAMDWLRPATVGERLCRRGAALLSCEPKETAVGRGAFITWGSEIANQEGEVLARMRLGTFRYVPRPARAGDGAAPRQERGAQPPPAPESAPAAAPDPRWEDLREGDPIPPLRFPLSVYRLVVAAGANRDFNAIHHNTEHARATGAPEMYANTMFLQGMWERALREAIGPAGVIRSLSGFRMRRFNTVGDTVTVRGRVARRWREGGLGLVEFEMWSENRGGVSVGPGRMVAALPLRAPQ
jgi:acyl dehydratase